MLAETTLKPTADELKKAAAQDPSRTENARIHAVVTEKYEALLAHLLDTAEVLLR